MGYFEEDSETYSRRLTQNLLAGVRRISESLVHLSLFVWPSPRIRHPKLEELEVTKETWFHFDRVYGDQEGISWGRKQRHRLYMWAAGPEKTACSTDDVVAILDPPADSAAVRLAEAIGMPSLLGQYHYPEAEGPAECWKVAKKYFWPHLALLHMRSGLAPQSWEPIVSSCLPIMDGHLERLNRELKGLNPQLSHIELPPITREAGDLRSYYTNIAFFAGAQYQYPAADIEAFVVSGLRRTDVREETKGLETRLKEVFGKKAKIDWVMSPTTRQEVENHLSLFEAQKQTPR
jgi:hypothetical protein